MRTHATEASTPAVSATEDDTAGRARRCVNRTCGRYFNKVHGERRCVSCGRSMKPALLAPFFVVARRFR